MWCAIEMFLGRSHIFYGSHIFDIGSSRCLIDFDRVDEKSTSKEAGVRYVFYVDIRKIDAAVTLRYRNCAISIVIPLLVHVAWCIYVTKHKNK